MKKLLVPICVILSLFVGFMIWYIAGEKKAPAINSFDECAKAGYPIQESYPERCVVTGGPTFTKTYKR